MDAQIGQIADLGSARDRSTKQVEWIITEKCNFRCSYCTCATGPHAPPTTVEEVLHYVAEVFGADRMNLCGGEPTIHPQILDVARRCRDHGIRLTMDTNLSLPVKRMLGIVSAAGDCFGYLHTTLHAEFHAPAVFCDKVKALRESGCEVIVRLIALHDRWPETQSLFQQLCDAGLQPKLKLEKLRRRDDPSKLRPEIVAPYSDDQLRWLSETIGVPVPDMMTEFAYQNFIGQPCEAGLRYVYIGYDGAVYRCAGAEKFGGPLGHVRDLGPPATEPLPCSFRICPCREAQRLSLVS